MEEKEKTRAISEELREWQARLNESDAKWSKEVEKMNEREAVYNGDRTMQPLVPGDTHRDGTLKKTSHVRNITFENIESQVSSSIPQPKVTPRRKKDEHLADVIEHFLRNELDRLPFEALNDLAERTVPIQGGVGFLVEWDNTKRTSTTVGEVNVTLIHPQQFAPQPNVYTGIADMDYFIVKVPTTKGYVERRYGVLLENEGESEPDVRGGDGSTSDRNLTLYIGYKLNERGGIDRYTWVNDTELENLKDYQARRQPVCKSCGKVKPLPGQEVNGAAYSGGACPWCGGKDWESKTQDFEELYAPVQRSDGTFVGGMQETVGENGLPVQAPVRIPYYRPDRYPIILQRSVSVFGQLLGNSDVDMIRDQQNTSNRIEQKIIDRLMKAGTRITLPDRADRRALVHRKAERQKPHRRLRFFGQFAVRAHVSQAGVRRGAADHRHHGQLSGQAGHDRNERQGQRVFRCAGGGASREQARDEKRRLRRALRNDVQVLAGVLGRAAAGDV